MSKLGKVLGVPKTITIRGENFKIYPLQVKDLKLLMQDNPTQEMQVKMSKEILRRSLKDEEITDEEMEQMDVDLYKLLMNEIASLNGLQDDERIRKIKEQSIGKKP